MDSSESDIVVPNHYRNFPKHHSRGRGGGVTKYSNNQGSHQSYVHSSRSSERSHNFNFKHSNHNYSKGHNSHQQHRSFSKGKRTTFP